MAKIQMKGFAVGVGYERTVWIEVEESAKGDEIEGMIQTEFLRVGFPVLESENIEYERY